MFEVKASRCNIKSLGFLEYLRKAVKFGILFIVMPIELNFSFDSQPIEEHSSSEMRRQL